MKNKTYYYHSPRIEGEKRHTIAGVLNKGEMSIGIASCSKADVFIKSKGRELAEERATKAMSGKICVGKNAHMGIAFRAIAVGIVASMMSNKYKF